MQGKSQLKDRSRKVSLDYVSVALWTTRTLLIMTSVTFWWTVWDNRKRESQVTFQLFFLQNVTKPNYMWSDRPDLILNEMSSCSAWVDPDQIADTDHMGTPGSDGVTETVLCLTQGPILSRYLHEAVSEGGFFWHGEARHFVLVALKKQIQEQNTAASDTSAPFPLVMWSISYLGTIQMRFNTLWPPLVRSQIWLQSVFVFCATCTSESALLQSRRRWWCIWSCLVTDTNTRRRTSRLKQVSENKNSSAVSWQRSVN